MEFMPNLIKMEFMPNFSRLLLNGYGSIGLILAQDLCIVWYQYHFNLQVIMGQYYLYLISYRNLSHWIVIRIKNFYCFFSSNIYKHFPGYDRVTFLRYSYSELFLSQK